MWRRSVFAIVNPSKPPHRVGGGVSARSRRLDAGGASKGAPEAHRLAEYD
jgi:hypothetical protein